MTTLTMDSLMFPQFLINPIKALHKLKEAGFTEKQAEAQIEIFSEHAESMQQHVQQVVATKRDLKELELSLKRDIREMELRFENKIKALELEMNNRFREMEMKLTLKIGAITSAVVGFFYLLERFF